MHLSTVKVPIDFVIECARSSVLFLISNQLLSSTYWQFFFYRPPGKFRYTTREITKMWRQELDIYMYMNTLSMIDMDFLYR